MVKQKVSLAYTLAAYSLKKRSDEAFDEGDVDPLGVPIEYYTKMIGKKAAIPGSGLGKQSGD